MLLSDKTLDEFRDIYRQEFGNEITRDEAAEMGARLITLVRHLLRPLPEDVTERNRPEL